MNTSSPLTEEQIDAIGDALLETQIPDVPQVLTVAVLSGPTVTEHPE